MISDPASGDIAIGSSGQRCEVLWVTRNYVGIASHMGNKKILISKVARFERPSIELQVGDRVRKIHFIGWTGVVVKIIPPDHCEVQWAGDKQPTHEAIADLEDNTEPRFPLPEFGLEWFDHQPRGAKLSNFLDLND